MTFSTKQRNYRIDNLRGIGTFLIILAHVGSPLYINNIRCFDVVLLAFVSGLSMKHTNEILPEIYKSFLKKRVKKLLIPTWLLILVWYVGTTAICIVAKHAPIYGISDFINALFLVNGNMGYVWIVKIYLFSAVLTPLIQKLSQKLAKDYVYYVIVATLFVIYFTGTFLYKNFLLNPNMNIWLKTLMEDYLLGIVAYVLVILFSYRVTNNNKAFLLLGCMIFFLSAFAMNDFMFNPNSYKYPPDLLYISYGLLSAITLMCIIPNRRFGIIEWISINSFSIYLLHTVFIMVTIKITNWMFRYVIVVSLTLFVLICYQKIKEYIMNNK